MELDDRLLPAAPYLTGPAARDVIAPVLEAYGGELLHLRPGQVLYRPGRELVVGYAATVRWPGGRAAETLLAGVTPAGPPSGTVVVEADGMTVGVWRYPFDPVLPGLADAVMAPPVARLLGVDPAQLDLAVVAFRPVKRAVVHARWPGGEAYLKVLPPARVGPVVARHEALLAAGVQVPEVIAADDDRGLVAMRALPGTELRHRLMSADGGLPDPSELLDVVDAIAGAEVPAPDRDRPCLLDGVRHHAAMVKRVLPSSTEQVDGILGRLDRAPRATSLVAVHGDLHEAQLRVDAAGRVIGVLDVDDVGPGDPSDDPARALAHLVALSIVHPPSAGRVRAHAARLHGALVDRFDPDAVHVRVAAALVGLSTGPFRVQDPDWGAGVARLVDAAHAWSTDDGAHERTLRPTSSASHPRTRQLT